MGGELRADFKASPGQVDSKNAHNHAGVFVVQDLDEPTAQRIQELSGLLGAQPFSCVSAWFVR